jgi:prenyltransferase beta subunit
MLTNDISLPDDRPNTILVDQHAEYLSKYAHDDQNVEKMLADYLKMSGIYWSFTAMDLIGELPKIGTFATCPLSIRC